MEYYTPAFVELVTWIVLRQVIHCRGVQNMGLMFRQSFAASTVPVSSQYSSRLTLDSNNLNGEKKSIRNQCEQVKTSFNTYIKANFFPLYFFLTSFCHHTNLWFVCYFMIYLTTSFFLDYPSQLFPTTIISCNQ